MATATMTVRLDPQVKKQFDALCQQFGMSSNTAINVFVNQVVRSRSIPFTVTADAADNDIVRERALAAFECQREKADRGETPDLTLEEINAEIKEARNTIKERELRKGA